MPKAATTIERLAPTIAIAAADLPQQRQFSSDNLSLRWAAHFAIAPRLVRLGRRLFDAVIPDMGLTSIEMVTA